LRDSFTGGEKKFRESSVGKILDEVDTRNGITTIQFWPDGTLFASGIRPARRAGGGPKSARHLVSESRRKVKVE